MNAVYNFLHTWLSDSLTYFTLFDCRCSYFSCDPAPLLVCVTHVLICVYEIIQAFSDIQLSDFGLYCIDIDIEYYAILHWVFYYYLLFYIVYKMSFQVDPTPFYTSCVSDACACDSGGDCECFCTAVASYAEACNAVGVCVSWRTPKICRKS